MGDVLNLNAIKKGLNSTIDFVDVKVTKAGEIPLKTWRNVKCILDKNNIEVKLNAITHEVEYSGVNAGISNNGLIQDIQVFAMNSGFNVDDGKLGRLINRVAEESKYNPFIEMLQANDNEDIHLIEEVFNCISINEDFLENREFYFTLFLKWCLGVVTMAFNDLKVKSSAQGVLVLQGEQGARKSTFFRELLPDQSLFKGDNTLDPSSKDSVIQNTKYILVDLGEIDSTFKSEMAKLKQFITATEDEYRAPYMATFEKYPRLTSFCGSVNKMDFLKDETGNRRWWVIPVGNKNDIDKLREIDKCRFWGAVYNLYKNKSINYWLDSEETEKLNQLNVSFNYENDVTIILKEGLNWEMSKDSWGVYSITEIANHLGIAEKKKLKMELEKMGLVYKTYRVGSRLKKGFSVPYMERRY